MGKMIDLINQRFGNLVVIENMGKIDGRRYYWKCQCDCGNIITLEGSRLRSGNTKSCGCQKGKGLQKYNQIQSEQSLIPIGTQFGKLTVIQDLGLQEQVVGHKRRYYLCQCECGNLKEVMGNSLKTGHVISCGNCLTSTGEYRIKQILDVSHIIYKHDSSYEPLTQETNRNLRFDFIIYNNDGSVDRFVEFDGRQHFTGPDTNYWGHTTDTLQSIQEKDNIKNNFCLSHKLKLIRIPYWHKNITYEDIFSDKYLLKGSD